MPSLHAYLFIFSWSPSNTSDTISIRFTSLLSLLKSMPLVIEMSRLHFTLGVKELYEPLTTTWAFRFIPSKCDLPWMRRSFQNFNISFREFNCVESLRIHWTIYRVCQFAEKLKNPPFFSRTHEYHRISVAYARRILRHPWPHWDIITVCDINMNGLKGIIN